MMTMQTSSLFFGTFFISFAPCLVLFIISDIKIPPHRGIFSCLWAAAVFSLIAAITVTFLGMGLHLLFR